MNLLIFFSVGILLQLIVLYFALQSIKKQTNVFPEMTMLKVFEKYVPKDWLKKFSPAQVILESLKPRSNTGSRLEKAFTSALDERIIFLKEDNQFSDTFKKILSSINHLLIKKRELFTLDLAQQITESHLQKGKSSGFVYLPLLLAVPFMVSILLLPNTFSALTPIALMLGVALTSILVFFIIKNRLETEYAQLTQQKSQFSVFLQTELLPNTSNLSLNTILFVLQQNLETFNERFTTNMEAFHKTVQSLNENHKVQRDFVEKLKKLSLNEIGNFNLQVIERFENVILKMHKFETWFDELNQNTEKSILLAKRLDHLIETAEKMGLDIGSVSQNIDQRLDESNDLLKFLKSHFNELESRKQLINHAVIDFDEFMKNALQELESHTRERVDSIRDITLKEEDFMIKAFEKNRDVLTQLNHLPELLKIGEQITKLHSKYQKDSQNTAASMRSLIAKLEAANHNLEIIRIESQNQK